MKLYSNFDADKKKGFILDPNSLKQEQSLPLELKVEESKLIIKGHLQYFLFTDENQIKKSACFVSSSHGKDSVILVYLIKKVCDELKIPMIPVFLNNTLNLFPEEMGYWKKFNKRYGITDAFKSFLPPKDEEGKQITVFTIREKIGKMENFRNKSQKSYNIKTKRIRKMTEPDCCEKLKFLSVNDYLENEGSYLLCSFDGRRAEENRNRSRLILQKCRTFETNHKRPRKIRTCLPLGFWTENDIIKFAKDNFIPFCPSYKIHDLTRMGCRNCVAYKSWMIEQSKDPTGLRFYDLKKNMEQMEILEKDRLIETLEYAIKKIKRDKLVLHPKALKLISDYGLKYSLIKRPIDSNMGSWMLVNSNNLK